MPRTPARFTQADIARVVRAIAQTGEDMAVEITRDGAIKIYKAKKNEKSETVEEDRLVML